MTTEITKYDDLIDVRDLIERFEELEGERKPWVAGWNMPGYMPDAEPAAFESFDDARAYIIDEVERASEQIENDDEANALVDLIRPLESQDNEGDWGETIGNYHYFITRADIAFDTQEEQDEYNALKSLLDDLCGNGGDEQWRGDWYPITLIRESYFTTYAQELCEDVGDIPRDLPSYIEIDWEATARNLRVDYSSVDFDDVTYLYR